MFYREIIFELSFLRANNLTNLDATKLAKVQEKTCSIHMTNEQKQMQQKEPHKQKQTSQKV